MEMKCTPKVFPPAKVYSKVASKVLTAASVDSKSLGINDLNPVITPILPKPSEQRVYDAPSVEDEEESSSEDEDSEYASFSEDSKRLLLTIQRYSNRVKEETGRFNQIELDELELVSYDVFAAGIKARNGFDALHIAANN